VNKAAARRPRRQRRRGQVDVAFDVIGGEVAERTAPLVRAGGTLVTIIGPPKVRPADGRAIFFEPDRFRLADLAERVRFRRLNPAGLDAGGRPPQPPGPRRPGHPLQH